MVICGAHDSEATSMKVSTTVSETHISIELEPSDGTDKMLQQLLVGITGTARIEVNGVIRFTVERPKRPLKYEHVEQEKNGE